MDEVLQFLKDNQVFFLATSLHNKPKVRPFGAITKYNNRLYLVTNNQKEVFKQIFANPYVELCAYGKDNTWLRVETTLISDQDINVKKQMLEDSPSLKELYSIDDGVMEVLYLKNSTATFYSFVTAPITYTF